MLIRKWNLISVCFMAVVVLTLIGGACVAQQPAAVNIWQLVPPSALLVAGYDGRPENCSMQAIMKTEDAASKDTRVKQQIALRKAVEDFSTLFGISLDFAKDIDSWAGDQWVVVLLPDDKEKIQPVIMFASNDGIAANAALKKMIAPWQRVGEITLLPDSDFPITAFKRKDIEAYASAYGIVVAISPSKASLKKALQGGGFAEGSVGDKTFKALSGSMFYMFADPALLKTFMVMGDIPVSGFGLGFSAVETGLKIQALGFPNEQGAVMLKQILSSQKNGVLSVNEGIPSASLVTAAIPDLSGLTAMVNTMMPGMSDNPLFGAFKAISDTQISAALTAALPMPAGVITASANSDQEAADKLAMIIASAKELKMPVKPAMSPYGIQATAVDVPNFQNVYLTQAGKHIVMASDFQSLSETVSTAKSEKPGIAQSDTYKEVLAGLGDSNLLTLYVNLAPVRGLGYLAEGLGLGQIDPVYGAIAKSIENVQALGVGVGYNGDAATATMFLRAKPGMGMSIGPAAVAGTAIGAAVMFPVFARSREAARVSKYQSDMRQLAMAPHKYTSDNKGKLPTSAKWRDQLDPYVGDQLDCPNDDAIYAFNKNLSGLNLDRIQNPSEVVMFFEANPDLVNTTGSRADAILPHSGQGIFAYADTHVRKLSNVPDQSQWVPKYAAPKPVKKAPAKKPSGAVKKRSK